MSSGEAVVAATEKKDAPVVSQKEDTKESKKEDAKESKKEDAKESKKEDPVSEKKEKKPESKEAAAPAATEESTKTPVGAKKDESSSEMAETKKSDKKADKKESTEEKKADKDSKKEDVKKEVAKAEKPEKTEEKVSTKSEKKSESKEESNPDKKQKSESKKADDVTGPKKEKADAPAQDDSKEGADVKKTKKLASAKSTEGGEEKSVAQKQQEDSTAADDSPKKTVKKVWTDEERKAEKEKKKAAQEKKKAEKAAASKSEGDVKKGEEGADAALKEKDDGKKPVGKKKEKKSKDAKNTAVLADAAALVSKTDPSKKGTSEVEKDSKDAKKKKKSKDVKKDVDASQVKDGKEKLDKTDSKKVVKDDGEKKETAKKKADKKSFKETEKEDKDKKKSVNKNAVDAKKDASKQKDTVKSGTVGKTAAASTPAPAKKGDHPIKEDRYGGKKIPVAEGAKKDYAKPTPPYVGPTTSVKGGAKVGETKKQYETKKQNQDSKQRYDSNNDYYGAKKSTVADVYPAKKGGARPETAPIRGGRYDKDKSEDRSGGRGAGSYNHTTATPKYDAVGRGNNSYATTTSHAARGGRANTQGNGRYGSSNDRYSDPKATRYETQPVTAHQPVGGAAPQQQGKYDFHAEARDSKRPKKDYDNTYTDVRYDPRDTRAQQNIPGPRGGRGGTAPGQMPLRGGRGGSVSASNPRGEDTSRGGDVYDQALQRGGNRKHRDRDEYTTDRYDNTTKLGSRRDEQPRRKLVSREFLSNSKFSECQDISAVTRKAIAQNFGFDTMSGVQALAIPAACRGNDILAKAQTGTGKTLAFCIPAIEVIEANWPPPPQTISVLIISPTRELADQIHEECMPIVRSHQGMRSGVIYGGVAMSSDAQLFKKDVDILVATPGRLLDHLLNTRDFADRFHHCRCLVLDEADRMLEMGFRRDMEKILEYLPTRREGRQTLLFSATVPNEVVTLAPMVLSDDFYFVDGKANILKKATAGGRSGGGGSNDVLKLVADDLLATCAQVEQDYLFTTLQEQMSVVFDLIAAEQKKRDHKIIVYLTTARVAQLYAAVAMEMGINALEIHSRKTQQQRERVSDRFKNGVGLTLFSSDVTARGLDYPDASFVLQVGAPADTEQYVHRLGRTARAGKQQQGRGTIVLLPDESYFVTSLRRLNIREARVPPANRWPYGGPMDVMPKVSMLAKACAYAAWLGYYNGMCSRLRWSREYLVQQANTFARDSLGCSRAPSLLEKTVSKMNLKGVTGLNVERSNRFADHMADEDEDEDDDDYTGYFQRYGTAHHQPTQQYSTHHHGGNPGAPVPPPGLSAQPLTGLGGGPTAFSVSAPSAYGQHHHHHQQQSQQQQGSGYNNQAQQQAYSQQQQNTTQNQNHGGWGGQQQPVQQSQHGGNANHVGYSGNYGTHPVPQQQSNQNQNYQQQRMTDVSSSYQQDSQMGNRNLGREEAILEQQYASRRGGAPQQQHQAPAQPQQPAAPQAETFEDSVRVQPSLFPLIIGRRGENIRAIETKTGCVVDLPPKGKTSRDDDVNIYITGPSKKAVKSAREMLWGIIDCDKGTGPVHPVRKQ